MDVGVGGTFDPIHDGHGAVFDRAFQLEDVAIGLPSDDLAPKTRHTDRYIRPSAERKRDLIGELDRFSAKYDRTFWVSFL